MQRTLILLCATLAAPFGVAQATPPETPVSRQERLEEAARARDRELFAETKAARRAWLAERRRIARARKVARDAGLPEPEVVAPERPALGPVVARYYEAALEFVEIESGLRFLEWIVTEGVEHDVEIARKALLTMARDHGQDPRLARMIAELPRLESQLGSAVTDEYVGTLTTGGAHPDLIARLMLSRHAETIETAERSSVAYSTARRELMAALEAGASEPLAQQIRKRIDVREKFGVGASAPDIRGIDLDGEEFALSDYEGKVIFLDFWGDW